MFNIRSQWQDCEISIFCNKSTLRKTRLHAETLVSKFRSALSVRLKDIAEKQVPMELKPILSAYYLFQVRENLYFGDIS